MWGRKKIKNRELVLSKKFNFRASEETVKTLKWLAANSGWRDISSVTRAILSGKKIVVLFRDPAVTAKLPDFQVVGAEIHELGVVINQLTESFHRAETPGQKMFFAMEVAELYSKVGEKVDQLIAMVSKLQVTPVKGRKQMTLQEFFNENGIEL